MIALLWSRGSTSIWPPAFWSLRLCVACLQSGVLMRARAAGAARAASPSVNRAGRPCRRRGLSCDAGPRGDEPRRRHRTRSAPRRPEADPQPTARGLPDRPGTFSAPIHPQWATGTAGFSLWECPTRFFAQISFLWVKKKTRVVHSDFSTAPCLLLAACRVRWCSLHSHLGLWPASCVAGPPLTCGRAMSHRLSEGQYPHPHHTQHPHTHTHTTHHTHTRLQSGMA